MCALRAPDEDPPPQSGSRERTGAGEPQKRAAESGPAAGEGMNELTLAVRLHRLLLPEAGVGTGSGTRG